jgi:hypothetical protein
MSMLEFPTFEEMVAVMNSPTAPASPMDHAEYLGSTEAEMEMSAEDMLCEIYDMMKSVHSQIKVDGSTTRGSLDPGAILMGNPAQP